MGEDTQRRRLPVWRTAKASFLVPVFNRRLALKLALIPVGIMFAVIAIFALLGSIGFDEGDVDDLGIVPALVAGGGLSLLPVAIAIPAITAWQRLVVLGRDNPQANLSYRFRKTEWSYLWRFIVYGAVMVLISVAAGGLTALVALAFDEPNFIVFAVAFVLVFAILQRFSLIFPAAAVGVDLGLWDSWRATRGNTWRLAAAVAAASIPIWLIGYGLDVVPALPESDTITIKAIDYLLTVVFFLFLFYGLMLVASVWSWAYRYLVEGEDIVLPGERA